MTTSAKKKKSGATPLSERIRAVVYLDPNRTADEFAASLGGITAGGVRNWMSGSRPTSANLMKIADKYKISLEWLMKGEGQMVASPIIVNSKLTGDLVRRQDGMTGVNSTDTLPVYATRDAGLGEMLLTDQVIARVARPYFVSESNGAFGVFVVGDSMSPAYRPGEIAYIDPALPCLIGDDVMLTRTGEDGAEYGVIRYLVSDDSLSYTVGREKPEPSTEVLNKSKWTSCYRIKGKQNK